ncbi:hypothetical protein ALQ88_200158 [Pseudomonas savastanoi]|nr:hypothetical protein ALQ88_200158 [Pseudomonas savastanoi]
MHHDHVLFVVRVGQGFGAIGEYLVQHRARPVAGEAEAGQHAVVPALIRRYGPALCTGALLIGAVLHRAVARVAGVTAYRAGLFRRFRVGEAQRVGHVRSPSHQFQFQQVGVPVGVDHQISVGLLVGNGLDGHQVTGLVRADGPGFRIAGHHQA